MKRVTILAASMMFLHAYGQNQSNFKSSSEVSFVNPELNLIYEEFLESQNEPFINANSETFKLNETIWHRPYGEVNYCLTPHVSNIEQYINRISDSTVEFRFIEVKLTDYATELLSQVNINVPNYVVNSVICYLPSNDIEYLIENDISLKQLTTYGKQMQLYSKEGNENSSTKALIWDEGFETNTVPGSSFNANNGTVNCGWRDVNCYSHNGSWSVWCAGNGAACNNCGTDYVNDMETYFSSANYINVSSYNDIYFNYWIDLDLNNSGTNDEFLRFEDLGSGTWSLAFTATSDNQWDGQLWQNGSVNYTGQSFNQYAFSFGFTSNFTGTSYGVYLDDLQLTGTSSASINESDLINSVNIYPNPTNGVLNIELNKNFGESVEVTVSNISGQLVYSNQFESVGDNEIKTIDISDLEKGAYTVQLITENAVLNRKLVVK